MKALVVGFGSIGARHSRILEEEGCDLAVVSRHRFEHRHAYASIADAVVGHHPDYVVIANRTTEHRASLAELAVAGHTGPVLVEKPLCEAPCEVSGLPFECLYVGYNLRFHPALRRLRALIADDRVLTVQVYAGQYLPDWRPGRDYRTSSSASRSAGGGVLRDLSHELDYLTWMLGSWRAVAASGGRSGALEVDCEDSVVALLELERCPRVVVQLNYLDRVGRRSILVTGERRTLELDLVGGRLRRTSSHGDEIEDFAIERDQTYRDQHRAVLDGRHGDLCSAEEGLTVLHLVAALEEAMTNRRWVVR